MNVLFNLAFTWTVHNTWQLNSMIKHLQSIVLHEYNIHMVLIE